MVGHRVEVAEGDVLELLLDRADAKPVRQRRIDLHRLERLVAALLLGHDLDRAHVVQPVGQLDDDDAHVLRHGEQHLAHILRLLLLAGGEADLAQLGHALHEQRHARAEPLLDLLGRDVGVLHHVVQQRGLDAFAVHAEVDQDDRDGDRVGDIRLPRHAALALVGLPRHLVGRKDLIAVVGTAALFDRLQQIVNYIVFHSHPPSRAAARNQVAGSCASRQASGLQTLQYF